MLIIEKRQLGGHRQIGQIVIKQFSAEFAHVNRQSNGLQLNVLNPIMKLSDLKFLLLISVVIRTDLLESIID